MRTLVVYYSRTGVTRAVAKRIAEALSADVEELIDTKNRKGPLGFLLAGKDAALQKHVPIEPPQTNPAEYDLVVIGTPVWAGTVSTAVRAYLTGPGRDIRRAAWFCTTAKSGIPAALKTMQALLGREPLATAGFFQKDVKRNEHIAALDAFLSKLREAKSP